jgi:SSS family solute:Na+ symporter
VLLLLLHRHAPLWLAGLLGAGIMAAVMASDSQILALSTMFTEDVFTHYGGTARFGQRVQVQTGRVFVVIVTLFAYLVGLNAPAAIFELAIQYALSGYAALSPLLIAALFWRRSTRWGALAVAVWTACAIAMIAVFQASVPAPPPGRSVVAWAAGGIDVLTRTPAGTAVLGFMPVVPMVLISALLMVVVSLMTPRPSEATLSKYFASPSR